MNTHTITPIKQKDIDWSVVDGETLGLYDAPDGTTYEIEIAARPTAKDIRWGATDTNVRAWYLREWSGIDEYASGEADGLRACKTAALAALNAHLVALNDPERIN